MRRVLVIGSPGAGKSTFSRQLAAHTGLPLIHLDQFFWQPDWSLPDAAEWDLVLKTLLARPEWILDGHYGESLPMRLAVADTVILLNVPAWLCVARILQRLVLGWGRSRPEMAPGCCEQIDLSILRYVWKFPTRQLPEVSAVLVSFRGRTIVLSSQSDATALLASLQTVIAGA